MLTPPYSPMLLTPYLYQHAIPYFLTSPYHFTFIQSDGRMHASGAVGEGEGGTSKISDLFTTAATGTSSNNKGNVPLTSSKGSKGWLDLDVVCVDEEGNDVRLPPVRVALTEAVSPTSTTKNAAKTKTSKTAAKSTKATEENSSQKSEKQSSKTVHKSKDSSSSKDNTEEKQKKGEKTKKTTGSKTSSTETVQSAFTTLATKAKMNMFQWLNKGKQAEDIPPKDKKQTKKSKSSSSSSSSSTSTEATTSKSSKSKPKTNKKDDDKHNNDDE